jgi:hypothetical protein
MGEKTPPRRHNDGRLSLLPILTERKVGPSRFPCERQRQVANRSRLASGLGERLTLTLLRLKCIRRRNRLPDCIVDQVGSTRLFLFSPTLHVPLTFRFEGMSQFYVKAEDEERCLQSSITRRPIMVQGLTTEGKVCPFSGTVQAVEKGHTQYPDYPLRITMK